MSLAQYADARAAMPLEFSPGDQWRYSRSFEIIGRVIEVASGQSVELFLRQRFLSTLGAGETFVDVSRAAADRVPTLYQPGSDGKVVLNTRPFQDPMGQMASTPADFLRFAQMLLNGGVVDGRQVLSKQSVQELLRNQLPPSLTPITTRVWDHKGYGFGLGGGVLVAPAMTDEAASPGTYRWAGSTGTFFWVDPGKDLVALLLTQSRAGYWLEHHFQRLVYGALEQPGVVRQGSTPISQSMVRMPRSSHEAIRVRP
jgi:CubicO group peptidase (beta-lactamase class C family)